MARPWTETQKRLLILGIAGRLSASFIARTLKRTTGEVRSELRQLVTEGHPPPHAEVCTVTPAAETESRSELMEKHLPLINHQARKMWHRLRGRVDFDDLVSDGVFGLSEAIDRFDSARGVAFATFAQHRIRFSMLDAVRKRDHASRLDRSRSTRYQSDVDSFVKQRGYRPTAEELPPPSAASAAFDHCVTIDEWQPDARLTRASLTVDSADYFDRTCLGLTRQEILMVKLYFMEQMTMREIGKVIGFSESRISQMMTSVLTRLRVNVEKQQQHEMAVTRD